MALPTSYSQFMYSPIQMLTSCDYASSSDIGGVLVPNAAQGPTILQNNGSLVALSIDSTVVALGNRVLLSGQTNAAQNGIWEVITLGDAATAWQMQRTNDFRSLEQLLAGQFVVIGGGSALIGSRWTLVNPLPSAMDVGNIVFVSSAGTSTFGNISITGNTIASTNTNGNINIDPNGTGVTAIVGAATFSSTVATGALSVSSTAVTLVSIAGTQPAASNQFGINLANTMRPASANSQKAVQISTTFDTTTSAMVNAIGLQTTMTVTGVGGNQIVNLWGILVSAVSGATAPVTNAWGIQVTAPGYGTSQCTAQFDAGVGIGAVNLTTSNAALAITSTTQGVLVPRLTTTQQNAIAAPTGGLIIYNTTVNKLGVYTGASWEIVTSG